MEQTLNFIFQLLLIRNCAPSFALLTAAFYTVKAEAPHDSIYMPNGQRISLDSNMIAGMLHVDDKRFVALQQRIE